MDMLTFVRPTHLPTLPYYELLTFIPQDGISHAHYTGGIPHKYAQSVHLPTSGRYWFPSE